MQKRTLVIGVVVLLAVIVAVVVVALTVGGSSASTRSGDRNDKEVASPADKATKPKHSLKKFQSDNSSSGSGEDETTDPLTDRKSVV